MGAINIITTILNLRAPGLSLMKMPMFCWTWLNTAYLLIAVMPVLAAAVTMILADRRFGTTFFDAAGAGDPVMYQHIFWVFGHPVIAWAHHMFTTGTPVTGQLFFMYATMLVAVPTGVKVFNRVATMWKGSLSFESRMLFGVGFIRVFTIGGFTGLILSVAPVDVQVQDTCYVVAHFPHFLSVLAAG